MVSTHEQKTLNLCLSFLEGVGHVSGDNAAGTEHRADRAGQSAVHACLCSVDSLVDLRFFIVLEHQVASDLKIERVFSSLINRGLDCKEVKLNVFNTGGLRPSQHEFELGFVFVTFHSFSDDKLGHGDLGAVSLAFAQ